MILVHLDENEQALGSKIDIPETFLDTAEKVKRYLGRFCYLLKLQSNVELCVLTKVP